MPDGHIYCILTAISWTDVIILKPKTQAALTVSLIHSTYQFSEQQTEQKKKTVLHCQKQNIEKSGRKLQFEIHRLLTCVPVRHSAVCTDCSPSWISWKILMLDLLLSKLENRWFEKNVHVIDGMNRQTHKQDVTKCEYFVMLIKCIYVNDLILMWLLRKISKTTEHLLVNSAALR